MSVDSWSPDYCMVCDRRTLSGPYCSQSCRLAEMDSTPPQTPASACWTDNSCYSTFGLPATDTKSANADLDDTPDVIYNDLGYAEYSNCPISLTDYLRLDQPTDHSPYGNTPHFHYNYNYALPMSKPYIHNTGSQTSLGSRRSHASHSSSSSTSSTPTTTASPPDISSEAMSELKRYSGLFDSVRKWKSKISYSSLS